MNTLTKLALGLIGAQTAAASESRLTEMKQLDAVRWREFVAGASAATARVSKSIETTTG